MDASLPSAMSRSTATVACRRTARPQRNRGLRPQGNNRDIALNRKQQQIYTHGDDEAYDSHLSRLVFPPITPGILTHNNGNHDMALRFNSREARGWIGMLPMMISSTVGCRTPSWRSHGLRPPRTQAIVFYCTCCSFVAIWPVAEAARPSPMHVVNGREAFQPVWA